MQTSCARTAGYLLAALSLIPCAVLPAGQVFDSGPDQVTLLELFTSEGCSSCPPAERWLNGYVSREALWREVVPVAWHVDYWDYIGWKDRFARPEHGARQARLARAGNARAVYTPGFFVNGREWRGWTLRLPPRAADRQPGRLRVELAGPRLAASFPADGQSLDLHVALLGAAIVTPVERGENRGCELEQEFVVLAHDSATAADGRWELALPHSDVNAGTRRALAVWVSPQGDTRPLQATGGWLASPVAD